VVSLVHEKFCEQQQQEEAGGWYPILFFFYDAVGPKTQGPILYEMTEFCRQQLENM
jgi:hypothetical protein